MILPIVGYGDPVLRKVGEEITSEFPNLKETLLICIKPCTMLVALDLQHLKLE